LWTPRRSAPVSSTSPTGRCELYAGVPSEVLDEIGVHASTEKQREAGVPEVVPAYIGQSCSREQGLEMAVDDVLRIERCPGQPSRLRSAHTRR
jgi:hypothetical protein